MKNFVRMILIILMVLVIPSIGITQSKSYNGSQHNFISQGNKIETNFVTSDNNGRLSWDGTNERFSTSETFRFDGDVTLGGTNTVSGDTTISGVLSNTGGSLTPMVSHPDDDATITLSSAQSGKLHIIPDLDADTVFTLPTAAAGIYYRIIYGGEAADAHDWQFDTESDTNFYQGGFVELDTDGNTVVLEAPNGSSNSIVNIFTPAPGTNIIMYCDGTNWFLSGTVHSDTADGVTWADQP